MTLKLFEDLRVERDMARSERDLCLQQLGVLTARHMELIASIKALSDMLRIKRPGTTHFQATEALVNRMITMAKRDYDALLADEDAVANLRKETGDD